jgi:ribulose 1,5-bisphosphate synthetase/thiazole synthase
MAEENQELPAREAMEFDVVIVGAGPYLYDSRRNFG